MAVTKLIAGLPQRTMTQEAFDAATSQLMVDLPVWVGEVNATAAGMNSAAAGGGFSLPYTFSTTITDADPGMGTLRLSSATQNASTTIRIDLSSAQSQDVTAVLDAFTSSSSVIKGQLRLVKLGDATRWLIFNLTAAASPVGYRNFTVANVGGSAASPFVNGDSLILMFSGIGDKGDVGIPYALMHLRDERASGTAAPAAAAGTFTRELNTVKANNITGASLAANQFTLPAGTYDFLGFAAYAAFYGTPLIYNVTDAAVAVMGMPHPNSASPTGFAAIQGRVTIAAAKVFELRHTVSGTATGSAFGFTFAGNTYSELFADVFITKGS